MQQQTQKSTSSASRAENRAAMPEVARIVDEFREAFGPGVRVVYAMENGREMGRSDAPLLVLAQILGIKGD